MGWRVDDELQQMLRDSAKHYLGDAGGPGHFRRVRESESGFDPAAWSQMAELGWTGILLPESAGGSGLGLDAAVTLAEELGRSISPEPFVASAVIAGSVLGASDTPAASALSGELARGALSVTLAWQEVRGTIGVPSFATRLADGRMSGTKHYVPAWHDDTGLLVAAVDGEETVIAVVDPNAPGVTVRKARLTDGTFGADIEFDGVAVGSADILLRGAAADRSLDLAISRGTIVLSAQLEGLAAELWQMTTAYMRQRSQFGSNLSDFQALRHRMVDLYSEIELAGASWRRAATSFAQGQNSRAALHAAKARCSQIAQDMGRWAIQYHGAFGYTDEADVGLYVHAGLRWSTWLGNPVAHRRAALAAHRRERA